MNKIKKYIKKYDNFFVLILLILIFLRSFIVEFENSDEVWNFSNIYQMCNGYEIYKDLNVIVTPMFFYIIKIIFKIFTANFFIFRICNIIINAFLYFTLYLIYKEILNRKTSSLLYTLITYLICSSTLYGMCNYNSLALAFYILGMYFNINEKIKSKIILNGIILFLIFMTKQNIGIYYGLGLILNLIFNERLQKDKIINLIKIFFISLFLLFLYIIYLYFNNNLNNFINYCFLGISEFKNNLVFDFRIYIYSLLLVIIFILTKFSKKYVSEKIVKFEYFSIPLLLYAFPIFNSYHLSISVIGMICTTLLILDEIFLREIVSTKTNKYIIYILTIALLTTSVISFVKWGIYVSKKQYINNTFFGSYISEEKNNNIGNTVENNIINITNYIKENENKTIVLSPYSKMYILVYDYNNGFFDLPFIGNFGKDGENGAVEKLKDLKNINVLIEKNEENLIYQESKLIRKYVEENFNKKGEIEQFIIYEK